MQESLSRLLPEERLLISLCRLQFSEEQKKEIAKLMKEVSDWNQFVRLANEHGIIALCRKNIQNTGLDKMIPEEFLSILHKGYLASLMRNTKIFELLKGILKIAEKENIDVVLIKGLALEKTIYGNQGLRQMNDLDILVKADSAIWLRKALLSNGFESPPMISPLHEKILISYGKHLPEMYKEGLSVEIHIKLFDQKGDSLTKEFIERSLSPGKAGLFCLPDTLLHFLYLVKHLDKHETEGISQLRLYTDLALLLSLRNSEILNGNIDEYARKTGLDNLLQEKLFLLNEFWGIEIPSSDIAGDAPEKEKIIEKFIDFLRTPKEVNNEQHPENILKPMKELEDSFSKFLFIAGYLFPSFSFMKYRYGVKKNVTAFFFYPVRWIKLALLIFKGNFR